MSILSKIFGTKKEAEGEIKIEIPEEVIFNKKEVSEWVEFKKQKPPHEVVLAACDTYDCGWVMDTAWWDVNKKCWRTTGAIKSKRAHLEYTHWRRLPVSPDGN